MRIRKISQVSGFVGTISNSYSTSNVDTYSCSYVNDKVTDIYSTTETLTNKVWIDNKPIYRRVHQYTSTSNSDNINIASWNIDSITFMQGFCYDSTNRQLDTNYYVGSSDYFRVLTRKYNNNHTITVQRGNSNSRLITIIIEYTKAS